MPAIIALGIATSYEDIKEGKIRNKYIIAALIFSIIMYSGVIIINYFLAEVHFNHFLDVIVNAVLALLLGFVLWLIKMWTEGDAKLYFAFAAIIPLSAYSYGYFKYIPSFAILLNTILPLFIYYIIRILFGTPLKDKISAIKKILKINSFLPTVLILFGISWIKVLLDTVINLENSVITLLLQYGIILFLVLYIKEKFKKNFISLLIIISVIRLILDRSIYNLSYISSFFFMMVMLILLSVLINDVGRLIMHKKIKSKDLNPNMILVRSPENKKNMIELFEKVLKIDNYTNLRITKNHIKKINDYLKRKNLKNLTFEVREVIPFAPYLFGGVILTLYVKGSVLNVLSNLPSYTYEHFMHMIILTIWLIVLSPIIFFAYRKMINVANL